MGPFSTLKSWFWPSTPGYNPSAATPATPDSFDRPFGPWPSDPAASQDPYAIDPYSSGQWTPVLAPVKTNPYLDQVRADAYAPPYTGPLDLDDYGRETSEMLLQYRELHRKEPSLRAAVDGKAAAVASLDMTVIPDDEDDPLSCRAAEFVQWTIERSPCGADGLIYNMIRPAFVVGHSANEKIFKAHTESKWYGYTGIRTIKNRDTAHLELRLDAYRNILGIVNTVRGLRTHEPNKLIWFTHAGMYDNPFGQGDVRAAWRACWLIDQAYKLWDFALKVYGAPFLNGTVKDPVRTNAMLQALQQARGSGAIVIQDGDTVDVINMASATSFQAFEQAVNKYREEIFLSIRGSFLPFLVSANGGSDQKGDSAVHKVASDSMEYLIAKAVGRCLTQQLVPDLVRPNFGDRVGLPQIILGGVNWAETKQQLDAADQVMAKTAISKKWLQRTSQIPPPDGPEDSIGGTPPAQPGQPGAPTVPGAPGTKPSVVDPTKQAPEPPKEPKPAEPKPDDKKPTFNAATVSRYAEYFAPDRHGRYVGNLHDEFGLDPQKFADATGLIRKASGKESQTWHWVPKTVAVPTSSIEADPARLQFRPFDGPDGLDAQRRAANTFDLSKVGKIAVWKDPAANQRTFVVDGHKRLAAAKAAGVPAIPAWYVPAKTADEARSIGAGLNQQQFAKDASGHEHAQDGKFGTTGTAAKAKEHEEKPTPRPSEPDHTKPGVAVGAPPVPPPPASNQLGGPANTARPTTAQAQADSTISALAKDFPEDAANPSTWEKVTGAAKAVHEAVYGWMVRNAPTLAGIAPELLDTPEDFQKFGFAPSLSGTGTGGGDALKDHLGISTHLAVSLASKAIAAGLHHAKDKIGLSEGDPAAALADLFATINKAIGADVLTTDVETIRKGLEKAKDGRLLMAEEIPDTTMADVSSEPRANDERRRAAR